MKFEILKKSIHSSARCGKIITAHGEVHTPCFMPIATRGAVKALDVRDLKLLSTEIVLSNTLHLFQKPGLTVIEKFHGLHRFMDWSGPILTDSGGFQVFSLSKIRKLHEEGVQFTSPLDGSSLFLTPEKSIEIQLQLGSDILMPLDDCPPGDCAYSNAKEAFERTLRWAERSKKYLEAHTTDMSLRALFGIVQGGRFSRLRKKAVECLRTMGFHGYAIGGVSVGEGRDIVKKTVAATAPLLPEEAPHYLMGVGRPEEIVCAVQQGIDMFDCVIPTREARHGRLYSFCDNKTPGSISLFSDIAYRTWNVKNEVFKHDTSPISKASSIPSLCSYSKAYLKHLFDIQETLAFRLATLQNVEFYLTLMRLLREGVKKRSV